MSFGFAGNQSDYFIFIVGDFNGPELRNSRQPQECISERKQKSKYFPLFQKDANYMFFRRSSPTWDERCSQESEAMLHEF